jgi:DNA-directed RNA polymerase specialized sigma24 family protein
VSGIETITAALVAHREGEPGAFDRLIELIYPELRRIARVQLRHWRPGAPLDTGSLVHEAYLKLVNQSKVDLVECRFFAGYSEDETAQILGVSSRTVERDWLRAKSWLRQAMNPTVDAN